MFSATRQTTDKLSFVTHLKECSVLISAPGVSESVSPKRLLCIEKNGSENEDLFVALRDLPGGSQMPS